MHLGGMTEPETMALVAAIVGAFVRVAKSRTVGDWLDRLPAEWLRAIPKSWLPWIAVAVGVVLAAVEARWNGHAGTWREAINAAIVGALAGGGAVAGHETVGTAAAAVRKHLSTPPPPNEEPKP